MVTLLIQPNSPQCLLILHACGDAHAAYRMIVCRQESESPTDTETNNGIDEDLAIIKASLMARRRPGARVITPSRHMSVSLVPKLGMYNKYKHEYINR